jgi:hypothetical protein
MAAPVAGPSAAASRIPTRSRTHQLSHRTHARARKFAAESPRPPAAIPIPRPSPSPIRPEMVWDSDGGPIPDLLKSGTLPHPHPERFAGDPTGPGVHPRALARASSPSPMPGTGMGPRPRLPSGIPRPESCAGNGIVRSRARPVALSLAPSGSLPVSAPFLRGAIPLSERRASAGGKCAVARPGRAPARGLPAAPGEPGPAVAARALRGDSEFDGSS